MIESFRDRDVEQFFGTGTRGKSILADLEDRLFRKLQMLDDATSDIDLRVPPSNHFEKLSGQLTQWHSIRVNRQWRLIFEWNATTGKARNVYLDPHKYRS